MPQSNGRKRSKAKCGTSVPGTIMKRHWRNTTNGFTTFTPVEIRDERGNRFQPQSCQFTTCAICTSLGKRRESSQAKSVAGISVIVFCPANGSLITLESFNLPRHLQSADFQAFRAYISTTWGATKLSSEITPDKSHVSGGRRIEN